MTITSSKLPITKVEFTCTANGESQYGPGCFGEFSTGSYSFEDKVGTWTGSANEITMVAVKNQVRATSIVVTLGTSSDTPAIEKPVISVVDRTVTITGPEGYGIIYTTDGTAPADGVGTMVESNTVTFNVEKSCTVKAISYDIADPDNVSGSVSKAVEVINVLNTPETALTVAEAIAYINTGENLDYYVYTKGTVHYIKELSTSYGNATYSIADGADTLIVFRGYGLDNVKFTAEDDLMVGDEVVVYGRLVNYSGNTPEYTTGNYLVSQKKVERLVSAVNVVEGALSSRNGVRYNLLGQKVNNASKGVIIVNGKKVLE